MEAANTAAHGFVNSRLDAGNSILYGIAQAQLQRIQRTQNTAARIITNTRRARFVLICFCHSEFLRISCSSLI